MESKLSISWEKVYIKNLEEFISKYYKYKEEQQRKKRMDQSHMKVNHQVQWSTNINHDKTFESLKVDHFSEVIDIEEEREPMTAKLLETSNIKQIYKTRSKRPNL